MQPKQLCLLELPEGPKRKRHFARLQYPIWTENKAKLIERYLFYFVLVTKHGTYIDAFAGPQEPDKPDMWAEKLVLESKPRLLRHFHLFDKDPRKVDLLEELKNAQAPKARNESRREVLIHEGDFNHLLPKFIEDHPLKDTEATFCLLDQRTFECHWSSLLALAKYKGGGMKVELFYFFAVAWFDRALANVTRNLERVTAWWGNDNWEVLKGKRPWERAELICKRIKDELDYESVTPFPIFDRGNRRIMYFMIHATDHEAAPNLMHRAYHHAVKPKETEDQLRLELKELRQS